jgi:co-chaperonin GroES (HSP10)
MTKMLELTDAQYEKACGIYRDGTVIFPAGYRILVRSIEASNELTATQAEDAPKLKELGFITKSNDQLERETLGNDGGIVVAIGSGAYKGPHLKDSPPWVELGQIIRFARYQGIKCEVPLNSDKWYRFINDEDPTGIYEETI